AEPGLSALVVLTLREERAVTPFLEESLAALLERGSATELRLKPFTTDEHHSLIEGLLPLDPKLIGSLVSRTAGNPLFAVQLVEDWVQRKLLEPHAAGFRTPEGDTPSLPQGVQHLWRERVERVVASMASPSDAVAALEIAAAFGGEVDSAEWLAACQCGRIAVQPDLVEQLKAAKES
ncbi:MAG: hypothetical protein L3J16_06265, partial [Anaerolineales bacterium]|nr:hypothetical protein [Anaerolineales bacterium]